jgi:hypothetical protein
VLADLETIAISPLRLGGSIRAHQLGRVAMPVILVEVRDPLR